MSHVVERELRLDAGAYSADAIQRAAYRLSDRLSLALTVDGTTFVCSLQVEVEDPRLADSVIGEFRNEVLDQVLRERIKSDTEAVRNLILSLAFSNTDLVEQD